MWEGRIFFDCQSEKALDYAMKIKHWDRYKGLKNMSDCLNVKQYHSVTQRNMFCVKLDPEETLEEFS